MGEATGRRMVWIAAGACMLLVALALAAVATIGRPYWVPVTAISPRTYPTSATFAAPFDTVNTCLTDQRAFFDVNPSLLTDETFRSPDVLELETRSGFQRVSDVYSVDGVPAPYSIEMKVRVERTSRADVVDVSVKEVRCEVVTGTVPWGPHLGRMAVSREAPPTTLDAYNALRYIDACIGAHRLEPPTARP